MVGHLAVLDHVCIVLVKQEPIETHRIDTLVQLLMVRVDHWDGTVPGAVLGAREHLSHHVLLRGFFDGDVTTAELDMTTGVGASTEDMGEVRGLLWSVNLNEAVESPTRETADHDVDGHEVGTDWLADNLRIPAEEGEDLGLGDQVRNVADTNDTGRAWLSDTAGLEDRQIVVDLFDDRANAAVHVAIPNGQRKLSDGNKGGGVATDVSCADHGVWAVRVRLIRRCGCNLTTTEARLTLFEDGIVDLVWTIAWTWIAVVNIVRVVSTTCLDQIGENRAIFVIDLDVDRRVSHGRDATWSRRCNIGTLRPWTHAAADDTWAVAEAWTTTASTEADATAASRSDVGGRGVGAAAIVALNTWAVARLGKTGFVAL